MTTHRSQASSRDSATPGSPGAMAEFERFMPRVFDWALRLTRDRNRAMDIVQDVFLKWTRQCASVVPDKPAAWLRTVTARRIFELARSPGLRIVQADHPVEAAATPGDPPALAGADRDLLRDDVMQALGRLTEVQRDVVLARVLDDKTFKVIAEELDISESSIKTHYLRGLRSLRDALSPRWRDDP